MTPHEITEALKLRRKGVSDAVIGAGMTPPVTRQHVHAQLGPRGRRKASTPKAPAHVARIGRSDFAMALKAWRATRGLTQAEAAALLHVNKESLGFWEIGRNGCALGAAILLLMQLLDERDSK